jgi:hypothetical protein
LTEIEGTENAMTENTGQVERPGKRRNGKLGTNVWYFKMREQKTRDKWTGSGKRGMENAGYLH